MQSRDERSDLRNGILESAPASPGAAMIVRVITWAMVLAMAAWLAYFAGTTMIMPYPLEYREGAAQVVTEFLLRGENPFSMQSHPLSTNNYGVGYPLAVLPLAAGFGNTLLVHRGITLAFIALGSVLVFATVRQPNRDATVASLCALLVAIGLTAKGSLGAFPHAMGTCLFLGTVLLPNWRSFDRRGLAISAMLAIAAFMTKPYFVLGAGIVAAYVLMFVSIKRGLVYVFVLGTATLALVVVLGRIAPLYLIDTIAGNLGNASPSLEHLISQLVGALQEYYPAVAAAGIVVIGVARKPGFQFRRQTLESRSRSGSWPASLQDPLLPIRLDYHAFFFGSCLLIFVAALGRHEGAYMTYFYQIVAPAALVWLLRGVRSGSRAGLIVAPLLLFNAFLLSSNHLKPQFLEQGSSASWAALWQSLDCSEAVLNSPAVTSRMIECGLWPIDSGQTEFFYLIPPYEVPSWLGPSYKLVRRQGADYRRGILGKIRAAEYDRLMLTETDGLRHAFLNLQLVSRHYIKRTTLEVEMPQAGQRWRVAIWVPTDSSP